MRKILQNKTAVSCLVAVAVLSVTANFIKFPSRQAMSATARENPSSSENLKEESLNVPPASRVERERIVWRELFPLDRPHRDPFAATIPTPAAVATNNVAAKPVLRLQSVSIEADRVLAVINQRVVAEGEQIEGCRVERILPTEVRLTSPLGPITVTFDRTPRRNSNQ
jgi:hypothetical protein